MRIVRRDVGIGFLCFTLIGLIFAVQFYTYLLSFGKPASWAKVLKWNLGWGYLWALLSPSIFWGCKRIRLVQAQWPRAMIAQFGFGVLVASAHVVAYGTWLWIVEPMGLAPDWSGTVRTMFARGFCWDILCYAAIAAVFYALDNARRYREGQTRASRLEAQLAQAQLAALRMQLHPHFLFNTLNAIAALISDDPKAAEEMVTRLSDLLRLALEKSDVQLVPLRDELEFVRRYLDIQRVRFSDRLEVHLDLDPETLDLQVPTFILQPVIENAVRHGLNSLELKCQVDLAAKIMNGVLRIEVHDCGPGLESRSNGRMREGIGLSNTRARLQQLYGDGARLELRNAPAGGCVVSLELPTSPASSAIRSVKP
jgi:hypothetical protein